MIASVKNTLVLSSALFPESINCWNETDLNTRPHKISLINMICHIYLTIRFNSYSKILTLSTIKEVNKRQKLHKTILFNNM